MESVRVKERWGLLSSPTGYHFKKKSNYEFYSFQYEGVLGHTEAGNS
jgi:hypothetical protein